MCFVLCVLFSVLFSFDTCMNSVCVLCLVCVLITTRFRVVVNFLYVSQPKLFNNSSSLNKDLALEGKVGMMK